MRPKYCPTQLMVFGSCFQVSIFSLVFSLAVSAAEPVVHMLVPGCTVRELPVRLSNINNLRFAPDGRLTALGYDGRIHLLRDTDGDGLEDQDELFWDKPTISVPVGMVWSPEGLYVSSHGKVSLLRDTDHDGKADVEEVIASGWPPTDVGSGGVDATAVTRDQEGNLYFGLLVADYSNAYRLRKRKDLKPDEQAWLAARGDKGGDPEEEVSLYDINSPRGTIQKWNAKTRKLETIATGIRVPYTLAFNRHTDLFVTDQEGETWMPNGNPLDELNHIIPGRNYGFPPRHEKWLPNLVSEPPVVVFGPQHQSSCGFVFNEPEPRSKSGPGRGRFGPKWWEGDAIVAGESRGKIWRVRLVKTPHGYVGKETIIARLSMLTTDVAISPKGALYVSCHSGPPDWGTGPQGEGKLFKISYTDPNAPQPVAAWAAGPMEVRVAFDKPLDPGVTNAFNVGQASRLSSRSQAANPSASPDPSKGIAATSGTAGTAALPSIEFGEYVRAGDRYEVLKPPYQVVKNQEATPRGKLNIVAAKLDNDNHTLVLTTDLHSVVAHYALTIPGVKAKGKLGAGDTVDVDYDLNGALASFVKQVKPMDLNKSAAGRAVGQLLEAASALLPLVPQASTRGSSAGWAGWLPAADRSVADAIGLPFTPWRTVEKAVHLTKGDIYSVAFELDLPVQDLLLHARASSPLNVLILHSGNQPPTVGAGSHQGASSGDRDPDGRFTAVLDFTKSPDVVGLPARLSVSTENGATDIELFYSTKVDPTLRPLPLTTLYAPWLPMRVKPQPIVEDKTDLAGGDYERGRGLFFDEQLKCATCHRIRGEGATVGPDLSNLVSRDAASVLRDLKDPNASINPDYVAYNVALHDGRELTGFVRAQDAESLRLISADGKENVFSRAEVKELRASSVSLMPSGLIDTLKEEQVRDLLTFLMSEPPKRTRAEVEAVLGGKSSTSSLNQTPGGSQPNNVRDTVEGVPLIAKQKLNIVLIASKQDHGPGQHDYPAWQKKWHGLLGQAPGVTVTDGWLWPTTEQFEQADLLVFYFWNHDWNADRYQQLDAYLEQGRGIVLLHSATIADKDPEQLAARIGLAAQPGPTKYLHCPLDLAIVTAPDHPITRGLQQIHLVDEPYWPMIGDTNKVQVLATTAQEGKSWPMLWTFQRGKGRVFASIIGHYSWTHDDPMFRILALRGLAWAAGVEENRFEKLAMFGDQLADR